MVVTNSRHETALVIRRNGETTVFVRLVTGKLSCERMDEGEFRAIWRESTFPLAETIERFLACAATHGATQEALRGLNKLKERDRTVIASLF